MKVAIDKQASEQIAGVKISNVWYPMTRVGSNFLVNQYHRAAEIFFLVLQCLFQKKT